MNTVGNQLFATLVTYQRSSPGSLIGDESLKGFQASFITEMSHKVKRAEHHSSSPLDSSRTMDTHILPMRKSLYVDGELGY